MTGRGAFFLAVAVAGFGCVPHPACAARAARAEGAPDVAPALLPEEWFGRPASPYPLREWQRTKSPTAAMVASFVLPGLGQLYNEREGWAIVVAGIEFYFIGEAISEQRETNRLRALVNAEPENQRLQALFELHRDNRTQAQWLLGLTALLSGLQSFVDAHLFDFDESALPIQVGPMGSDGAAARLRLRF